MLELLDFELCEIDDAEDFGLPEDDEPVLGDLELADEITEVTPDAEETVVLEWDEAPGVDDPNLPDPVEPRGVDDIEVPDADEVPGGEEEAEDFGGVGVGMATMLVLDAGRTSGASDALMKVMSILCMSSSIKPARGAGGISGRGDSPIPEQVHRRSVHRRPAGESL